MAKKESQTAKDVAIYRSRDVKQITVPEKMTLKEAIKWLEKKDADDEKQVAVNHRIDCFPLDGALAFADALYEVYGFIEKQGTPGFFGTSPPTMVGIPVGPNEIRQVPWGRMAIPGIEGYLQTSLGADPHPIFVIGGVVKQRHLPEIERIVQATKERLRTNSIYKGKAFELDLSWMREGQDFSPLGHAPKFTVPTGNAKEEDLILSENTGRDVRVGLFTPIDHAKFCERSGIPAKRGVLLYGEFGTGKTLCAWVCASKAVRNGITFIYLKNVLDLANALKFARQYEPAIVYAEDIDRVANDAHSEEAEQLRNAFDGVDGKTSRVMVVLTTNYLEKLDQALLRPGRCDLLVKFERPDEVAAVRLVRLYGGNLLSGKIDMEVVGKVLKGHLPAEIREVVERSKMACIERLCRKGKVDETVTIEGQVMEDDLMQAVGAMDVQHKLLKPKKKDERTTLEKFAGEFGKEFGSNAGAHLRRAMDAVAEKYFAEASANGDE